MSPGISTRLLATQSDERLLRLVREGHERAFEALVNRYRKPLLSYCRRLSLPEGRTEDVLQQALLKTWIALRDGAEVRDIKAWLYRVVHNAAVNAVRDAAYDRERVADPTLRVEGGHGDLERGLAVREALAEVAALPPMQREVIVRTAVGGHSHEQVASDLGLSDGAVRGLLYRARATLRTAATALTPPQLLFWLAGRADQGAGAPERLGELAGGGGTLGLGGLLLKGGVAAVTAGTLITGAAVVQLQGSGHHRHPHPGAIAGAQGRPASTVSRAATAVAAPRQSAGTGGGRAAGHDRTAHARDVSLTSPSSARVVRHGGAGGSTQRGVAVGRRRSATTAPGSPPGAPAAGAPAAPGSPGVPDSSAKGQGSSGAGTSSGDPVGSAAGAGSPEGSGAGSGTGVPLGGGAGEQQAPAGSESGGSTPSGSGGESSGSSGGSGGEQSGGLVKTVVHEVGSAVGHLLH